MKKYFLPILIILIFSLVGTRALLHPGLFSAHDIWHQVARLYHYRQAVSDGQLPPYWIGTLANGFGYPLFFFSYHLPWLSALPFLSAGIGIPQTLKILFMAAYFLSGVFMYLFAKDFFESKMAGLLSAILYLWAPYRFLTILVSASIGTVFVFVFLPILLWGIYKICQKENRLGIILTAIGLAGVILSHLATLASLVPLIFLFTAAAFAKTKLRRSFIKNIALGLAFGILLSSFYLFPAIFYAQYTQAEIVLGELYKNHFLNFSQLVYSKWGYGIIQKTAKEGAISFQVGIAQWLSVAAVTFLLLFGRLKKVLQDLGVILLIGFAVSIFAMLDESRPVWDLAANFITLDFPTRFMLPVTFLGSVAAGLLLLAVKKQLRPVIFTLLLVVALYTNRNHLRVNMYTDFPVSLYVDSEVTTTSFHEFLPAWADIGLLGQISKSPVYPESLTTSHVSQNTKSLSFKLTTDVDSKVSVRQFFFPGQTLYVDGKRTDFGFDERGRILFLAPAGTHEVIVRFEETPVIFAGKLISLFGIVGLINIWRKRNLKSLP